MEYTGIVHQGGAVLSEIFDGHVESVLGEEYVMTHTITGRQFLCIGDERTVMMILDEKLRLEKA